jgi:uncharacterized delta-60 repeat protein
MTTAKQAAGVLALALSLGSPAAALAAAGDLDTAFGTGGRLTTDFAGSEDAVAALVIQPDGKLLAAGRATTDLSAVFPSGLDFALARYNPDGSLDTSFGIGGKITTDFAGDFDVVTALVLQSDGKLVAAGISGAGARAVFALARYLPGGSLDPSFGSGGKLTTDFAGGESRPTALVLQPDGKLVAAGAAATSTDHDFALVRYNTDGSLDASFGNGGRLTTDFSGSTDELTALVLQPDGKLVAAGYTFTGAGWDFALARYHSNGSLDTAFGTGGKVTTDFADGHDTLMALVLQPDGKLVAGGNTSTASTGDFALARYNPDGNLDVSFGDGGKRTTDFAGLFERITALILQPNGKVIAAGLALTNDSRFDFALARYGSSGRLDATFGTGGKVLTDFARGDDLPFALARQADGKLVAAGITGATGRTNFALARYLAPIEQNQPPVANAGSYPAKECTGRTGTLVSLDGSASHDPDEDSITYSWDGPFGAASGVNPTVLLPLGTSSIAVTVADTADSSTTALTQVTIVDTTAPNIGTLVASPSRLRSHDHKMVPVTAVVSAADVCSAATTCRIVSVSSNEPVDGQGRGDKAPDWEITGTLTVELRAERAGKGTGRIYTITVECTDASGNKSSKPVTVAVR